jgi:hypothetical protein
MFHDRNRAGLINESLTVFVVAQQLRMKLFALTEGIGEPGKRANTLLYNELSHQVGRQALPRPLAVISNEERNLASHGKNVSAETRFLLPMVVEMTRRGAAKWRKPRYGTVYAVGAGLVVARRSSMASQIWASMQTLSKRSISWIPVGEVTLISVR